MLVSPPIRFNGGRSRSQQVLGQADRPKWLILNHSGNTLTLHSISCRRKKWRYIVPLDETENIFLTFLSNFHMYPPLSTDSTVSGTVVPVDPCSILGPVTLSDCAFVLVWCKLWFCSQHSSSLTAAEAIDYEDDDTTSCSDCTACIAEGRQIYSPLRKTQHTALHLNPSEPVAHPWVEGEGEQGV